MNQWWRRARWLLFSAGFLPIYSTRDVSAPEIRYVMCGLAACAFVAWHELDPRLP